MNKKKVLTLLAAIPSLVAMLIFCSDFVIKKYAQAFCYQTIENLPENEVGLVLGTAKYSYSGDINLYYQYRIDAAVELYNSGKIKYILVSGDNAQREYNEPMTFRRDLIARGIPKEHIFLDYAGFRTLDSIIRANKIFGQTRFTIISQRFHNERAVYIGRQTGLETIAYDAQDVGTYYGLKTNLREKLARVKTMLDVHLLHKSPKFLGDKVEITDAS